MTRAQALRQNKHVRLSKKTKMVRVDAKTLIEVSQSITDEKAIDHYYLRHNTAVRPTDNHYPIMEKDCFRFIEE